LIVLLENEGVVEWGDERHRERFLATLDAARTPGEPGLRTALRGDGPCRDCGTLDNIVWFTDSVFWNAVVRVEPRLTDGAEILCIPCFVTMADERGFICRWRLTPEWKWQTKKGRLESRLEDGERP
jgi:hypothetical protein